MEQCGALRIGQSEAVKAISRAVRRARSGLADGGRPVASMIFSGPTGVGKTELAKAVAASYYGAEKSMVGRRRRRLNRKVMRRFEAQT